MHRLRGSDVVIEDMFGRRLNEHGMVLVDWEGQIANPAIKIFLKPPPEAGFPARAEITATESRLYFDLPSTATGEGPTKTVIFPNATALPILVSIFPDRDGLDEEHILHIEFTPTGGGRHAQSLKVRVIDQDQPRRTIDFPITIDFSRDQTGFFSDPANRAIAEQRAQDWAYFWDGRNLAPVAAGEERTFIWNPDGYLTGTFIANSAGYRGFLLYAYGVSSATPPFRSGGEASSAGGFQSSGGVTLPLRRSGAVEIETKGNYNALGWSVSSTDGDWWRPTNLAHTQNDLASIVHHEVGHALVFYSSHTRFGAFKARGRVDDPAVIAYHGSAPAVDLTDHLPGATDRLSGKGAFGSEYYGLMPARRWLITKLDLLVSQAVGYTLRETTPFVPLAITTTSLPVALVDQNYTQTLAARGGVPFYRWAIKSGALAPGLVLDSFSGQISGNVTVPGRYSFVVELSEYDPQAPPVTAAFSLRVATLAEARPTIVVQPASQTIEEPGEVAFTIAATAALPLMYQWEKDGNAIVGATNATLTLSNVRPADAGSYRVNVTTAAGTTTSSAAVLAVNPAPTGPRAWLSNLSVRTTLASGQVLDVGLVVHGGRRDFLVRAAGPALASFGLADAMSDPRLELYRGGVLALENENWEPDLARVFSQVGAFAFTAGSLDAAFVQGIDGAGTIRVRGTGAGVVLAEVYQTGPSNSPRLVNVSARNQVGLGDDTLIVGFSLSGEGPKQLLVRAVGPKLNSFGVPRVLADPKLEVFAGATKLAENDNWDAPLGPVFRATGAFALDVGSRDAALLVTITPGSYTAQVRGADGGVGEALVEIYEIP